MLAVDVGLLSLVDNDMVAIVMSVELGELLLEADIGLLILLSETAAIKIGSHLAIVTSVELEHVTKGLNTFDLESRKSQNERG